MAKALTIQTSTHTRDLGGGGSRTRGLARSFRRSAICRDRFQKPLLNMKLVGTVISRYGEVEGRDHGTIVRFGVKGNHCGTSPSGAPS